MNISPNFPSDSALELLLKKLELTDEDCVEQLGYYWIQPDPFDSSIFFRIRKEEFDVAIIFGNDDRIDICPVEGNWKGPASLDYQPGKSVANMPFGEEWVSELEEALQTAAIKRRSTFTVCTHCNEHLPPEHMDEGKVCQSCAAEHLGVIY